MIYFDTHAGFCFDFDDVLIFPISRCVCVCFSGIVNKPVNEMAFGCAMLH